MHIRVMATALFFALACASASATIIYQQPAGGGGTWTSNASPNHFGWQTFDDFKLNADATITHVGWRGGALWSTAGNPPATLNPVGFRVEFYSHGAGGPDALLASTLLPFASVQRVSQGIETATSAQIELEVFEFAAAITPFDAIGGTQYWFSVIADWNTSDPVFVWRPGTGGDGESMQFLLASGGGFTGDEFDRPGDRAFTFADAPIPLSAPNSLALLLAALVGLVAARRAAFA